MRGKKLLAISAITSILAVILFGALVSVNRQGVYFYTACLLVFLTGQILLLALSMLLPFGRNLSAKLLLLAIAITLCIAFLGLRVTNWLLS